mmetsp:Transcript_25357/g.70036  ORF Transcript_25357/g.70036 Transcript_25357/m.70036 type:complete len:110 (-) Transcript_25357:48-377(-)
MKVNFVDWVWTGNTNLKPHASDVFQDVTFSGKELFAKFVEECRGAVDLGSPNKQSLRKYAFRFCSIQKEHNDEKAIKYKALDFSLIVCLELHRRDLASSFGILPQDFRV